MRSPADGTNRLFQSRSLPGTASPWQADPHSAVMTIGRPPTSPNEAFSNMVRTIRRIRDGGPGGYPDI